MHTNSKPVSSELEARRQMSVHIVRLINDGYYIRFANVYSDHNKHSYSIDAVKKTARNLFPREID